MPCSPEWIYKISDFIFLLPAISTLLNCIGVALFYNLSLPGWHSYSVVENPLQSFVRFIVPPLANGGGEAGFSLTFAPRQP